MYCTWPSCVQVDGAALLFDRMALCIIFRRSPHFLPRAEGLSNKVGLLRARWLRGSAWAVSWRVWVAVARCSFAFACCLAPRVRSPRAHHALSMGLFPPLESMPASQAQRRRRQSCCFFSARERRVYAETYCVCCACSVLVAFFDFFFEGCSRLCSTLRSSHAASPSGETISFTRMPAAPLKLDFELAPSLAQLVLSVPAQLLEMALPVLRARRRQGQTRGPLMVQLWVRIACVPFVWS